MWGLRLFFFDGQLHEHFSLVKRMHNIFLNKVSLQTSLEGNSSNFSYIYIFGVNFENLTVKFYVP